MTSDRFSEVLSIVLGFEGGYSNNPDDRGGRTNLGVTEVTLNKAYRNGLIKHNDIDRISIAEAERIYRAMYWDPVKGGLLPEPLDLILFDCAVNHGVGGAIRLLQGGLNAILREASLKVDGAMGPKTKDALATLLKISPGGTQPIVAWLCSEILLRRVRLYDAISTKNESQRKFLRGWIHNRVVKLGKVAGLN